MLSHKKLFFTILVFICSNLFSDTEKNNNLIELNNKFYKNFTLLPLIERDSQLEKIQNSIVQGSGHVESVDNMQRYHRHYRITAIDNNALYLNIRLFIFTDNEEYVTLLKKGDSFEFKGQLILYTPTNSKNDSYIFDIILEEGALNISSQ